MRGCFYEPRSLIDPLSPGKNHTPKAPGLRINPHWSRLNLFFYGLLHQPIQWLKPPRAMHNPTDNTCRG